MSTQPIVERAARVIDPDGWRLHDQGPFPPEHPAAQTVVRRSLATAHRLQEAGLLADTVEAVRQVVGKCENFTGALTCAVAGRDITSPYGAEGYCLRCEVRAIIDVSKSPPGA